MAIPLREIDLGTCAHLSHCWSWQGTQPCQACFPWRRAACDLPAFPSVAESALSDGALCRNDLWLRRPGHAHPSKVCLCSSPLSRVQRAQIE